MKKTLLSLIAVLALCFNSNAQVVDYLIPVGDLINMTVQTGDQCFDPGEYKQASVGNTWGFQWTSTNANTPTSVTVDFVSVLDEGLTVPTSLNGIPDGNVTMTPSSCGFVGQLFTMNTASYNPLGLNTILLDYAASATTCQIYPVIGAYAHVEVNYGSSCTEPDVPTLTASSPICPGASSTISISGNLNDATGWSVYTSSCGGTLDGVTVGATYVVSPATTTTYFIRGEGGCTTPAACGSITITVEDNSAPVPDVATLTDVNAECSSTPSAPTATDNCTGAITGTPDVAFPITAQGTTVVTWTYDDGNGNTSQQSQNVVINDVSAPVADIGSLTDITDECSASPAAPTATDNCEGTITGVPDVTFPITTQGTTTITWTYDDGNGNSSTQTQNVTLNDVTAPAPDAGSLADFNAECSASPTAPTATDNCEGTITGTPDVTFPINTQGTTVVTWTYDDGNGNTSQQSQNIVIDDVTDPVITSCPGDASYSADNAGCSAQIIWLSPMATDNCTGVTMTSTHNSGDTFPLGTTTVTYTATDVAGNTATCAFDITITSDLSASIGSATDIDCFGNMNGAINLDVTGGGTPYTFDWNSGAFTTEDLSGLDAGSYDVTVTDAFGCTATASATIAEPTALVTTITLATDPSSCGSADGSIDVTTTGGTAPFAFDWNSGAFTTEDISALVAGSYTLTVLDANGCQATTNATLNDPGAPTIAIASFNDATCNGDMDGDIDVDVTGGTMPYTYDWNSGAFSTEDISGLGAGTYDLVLTDGAGCSASISQTITEPAAIDVTVSQSGFDLTANATGLSYQWIDCATSTPITGETFATYSATYNGDFAVIITDGPCSDTSTCTTVAGVGVDEEFAALNVYPNPANNLLNIVLNGYAGNATIRLMDVSGKQVVFNQEVSFQAGQNYQIDGSKIERGTYLLRINYADKVENQLIIFH